MKQLTPIIIALCLVAWLMPVHGQDTEVQPGQPASEGNASNASVAIPATDVSGPAVKTPTLEEAYQREFAFLENQKRDLERRLARFESNADAERSALNREIQRLESDVVALGTRAERLDTLVFESELQIESNQENAGILEATFLQSEATLEPYGFELAGGDDADDAQRLQQLFAQASVLLERFSTVTREEGEYFLTDGTKVTAPVIRVGNIASYGTHERGSGVLAPAGEGQLKLWGEESGDTARALASGQQPETLKIFAYETLRNEVEESEGKSIIGTIQEGGVIGWIIVVLGMVALLLIALRALFLRNASASTGKIVDAVRPMLQKGRIDDALASIKRFRGSASRVVAATVRNIKRDREHLEDIVSEAILHESGALNRFGTLILVIAAVSPLLGLLGTVTGMISTFDVITEFGTGDPKLLSGGIAIALITTELGLIVAIPTLLFGNVLNSWAERIKDDMEKSALRVINIYDDAREDAVAASS